MLNEFGAIDNLINGIKGTTGFLSGLVTRKYGLVFLFIVLGVVISRLFVS
jgi:hypothetical protein